MDSKQWKAYHNKAYTYIQLKDLNAAITWINKAIEADPSEVEVYYLKGYITRNFISPIDSIQWFEKSLNINPKHLNSLIEKGAAYLQTS